MIEYIHLPEDEEIGPSGGSYRIKEEILDYKGRDILLVKSESDGDVSFCCGCGATGAGSIFVKGRINEWKRKNERDEPVSKLEEIRDAQEQREIKGIIEVKYKTSNVHF